MGTFTDVGLEDPSDEVKRGLADIVYKQLFVPDYDANRFVDNTLECIGVENTHDTKLVLLHGITLGKTILHTQQMMDKALENIKVKKNE